jgi:hypothetical protein
VLRIINGVASEIPFKSQVIERPVITVFGHIIAPENLTQQKQGDVVG